MSISIIEGQLASAVADDGTFTVNYPSGKDEGHFALGRGHKISVGGNDVYEHPTGVFLTFGATEITVKNKSGGSWAAGAAYKLQLEELGDRVFRTGGIESDRNKAAQLPITKPSLTNNAWKGEVVVVSLGAPDVADVDGICAAQAVAGAGALTLDGALVSGGEAVLDVPRGVEIDTSDAGNTTQVITITGEDEYGNAMQESLTANGLTAVPGKKAFKKVTGVSSDAAITGTMTVGTTDVLGLPVHLPATGLVLAELEDGAAASAGTVVAGDQTEGGATATTGDVRGTYDPNSAADGDKYFHVVLCIPDANYQGVDQFSA